MEITWTTLDNLGFKEEKGACGRGRSLYSKAGLHLSYWLGHGWMWQVCNTNGPNANQWLPLKTPSVKFIVSVLKALGETVPVSLEETVNIPADYKFQREKCWNLLIAELDKTMALRIAYGADRITVANLNGSRSQKIFHIRLRKYRDKGSETPDLNTPLSQELYNLPITNASSLMAKCLDIIKQFPFAVDILNLTIDDSEPNESYARFHTFEGWMILSVTNESNQE